MKNLKVWTQKSYNLFFNIYICIYVYENNLILHWFNDEYTYSIFISTIRSNNVLKIVYHLYNVFWFIIFLFSRCSLQTALFPLKLLSHILSYQNANDFVTEIRVHNTSRLYLAYTNLLKKIVYIRYRYYLYFLKYEFYCWYYTFISTPKTHCIKMGKCIANILAVVCYWRFCDGLIGTIIFLLNWVIESKDSLIYSLIFSWGFFLLQFFFLFLWAENIKQIELKPKIIFIFHFYFSARIHFIYEIRVHIIFYYDKVHAVRD